jgi:hypothetical protein
MLPPMRMGSAWRAAGVALLVILSGAVAAACGDADADEQRTGGVTEAFIELVEDLKTAALADEDLNGTERAEALEPAEEKVFTSFCETVWKLNAQQELDWLEDTERLVTRIEEWAEYSLPPKDSAIVNAGVARLRRDTELDAWDAALDRRYSRACYGGGGP